MQTYSCIPKQQNRTATITLVVFSVLLAFSVLAIALEFPPKPMLYQMLFLLFSGAVVYILIRYLLKSYTYTITLLGGEPHLIVTMTQGRRVTTVYHQKLAYMKEMVECTRGEQNQRSLAVDVAYSYMISMHPDRWQMLYFLLEDRTCVSIRIESSDEFLAILREALAYLRSSRRIDDGVGKLDGEDIGMVETPDSETEATGEA